MISIFNDYVVCFDVDDTLIIYDFANDYPEQITVNYKGFYQNFVANDPTIGELKDAKLNGAHVIVWSAAGAEWAHAVLTALNLEAYVDLVISKPVECYDDLPAQEFINRVRPLVRDGFVLGSSGIRPIDEKDFEDNSDS